MPSRPFMKSSGPDKPSYILDFVRNLMLRLDPDRVDKQAYALLRNFMHSHLQFPLGKAQADRRSEFEDLGTQIWNISTRISRENPGDRKDDRVPLLRSSAFFLLDTAHRYAPKLAKKTHDSAVRVFRLAMKAARSCLDTGELELCTQIFQRAADFVRLEEGSPKAREEDNDLVSVTGQLAAHFWLLRTSLAWKQGRLDTAEFMFSKVTLKPGEINEADLAEKQADLTYEIGRSLLAKEQFEGAVRWLERSCGALETDETEHWSSDASELRMSALHDLTRGLLGIRNQQSLNRAADLIALLESEFGNKMAVLTLKLELLSAKDPVPAEEYQRTVIGMITSVILTDNTFKTIMYHIQKLKIISQSLACKTLDNLLFTRLYEAKDMSWIEKGIVTRVWLSTFQSRDTNPLHSLSSILDEAHDAVNRSFSSDAAHAAQTLIWKNIESVAATDHAEDTEAWCRVGLHPVFDQAGDHNKCKLARKMILCALSRSDPAAAREAYFCMPEQGKGSAITKYLLYKVAIRSDDQALAAESLAGVAEASGHDATFLYACILEAQRFGNKKQTVNALQQILTKYDYGPPAGVYLPALLRCTAKLLLSEIVKDEADKDDILTEVSKIFVAAAAAAQTKHFDRLSTNAVSRGERHLELQWFAKNSYNMALKYCSHSRPDVVTRFSNVCVDFLGALRQEGSDEECRDYDRREGLCRFLAASAFVVLARSEDSIETSMQHYLQVRKQILGFEAIVTRNTAAGKAQSEVVKELDSKRVELLKYDLEAIVQLERWDDLDGVLSKCLNLEHVEHLEILADLLVVTHTHIVKANLDTRYHTKIPDVMQKLINQSWRSSGQDMRKISQWLRCVFRMTIKLNPDVSLRCIDQAASIATMSQGAAASKPYPQDELEWLASTAFNHGIDLYCTSDEAGCKQWGEKALNLAKAVVDDPSFYKTMQQHWLKLNLRD